MKAYKIFKSITMFPRNFRKTYQIKTSPSENEYMFKSLIYFYCYEPLWSEYFLL